MSSREEVHHKLQKKARGGGESWQRLQSATLEPRNSHSRCTSCKSASSVRKKKVKHSKKQQQKRLRQSTATAALKETSLGFDICKFTFPSTEYSVEVTSVHITHIGDTKTHDQEDATFKNTADLKMPLLCFGCIFWNRRGHGFALRQTRLLAFDHREERGCFGQGG
ncbi:hypothetical protein HPB49_020674 [Dermacentor silvarum]|uniref:Uncharacterized protein n=1 Tax=Dermacentor silvarum TaxID=543639 RepID=A0ACB8D848_DERSI|nr:hypothetical protein HPB49_020674 [Dermacentor silvarum]